MIRRMLCAGQKIFIRVLDKANSQEVGRSSLKAISQSSFELPLWVIVPNHSYLIEFYADLNKNNKYDVPPTDHAWRLALDNVKGDATVNFTHNTQFADIAWPAAVNDFAKLAGQWTGTWSNLTFATSAPIQVTVVSIPDSQKVRVTIVTSGMFGNPQEVTQPFVGTVSPGADSTVFKGPSTWTGKAAAKPGELLGSMVIPDLGNLAIAIAGNFGLNQLIASYVMSGPFNANGTILLNKTGGTGVKQTGQDAAPGTFVLGQNYPTPFNPETTIPFAIKETGRAVLKITDLLGRDRFTLLDEQLAPGFYKIRFNGSELTSGVYFYSLRTVSLKAVSLKAANAKIVRKLTIQK